MLIVDLAHESVGAREQAANLLVQHFDEPLGWPDMDSAREEVGRIFREGFARAMLDSEAVVGWVGGLPENNGRGKVVAVRKPSPRFSSS
jgi:hypothetical protein